MNIEEYIKSQQLPNYCYICQADLQLAQNVISHYNSKRHKTNVDSLRENLQKKQNEEPGKKSVVNEKSCNICNVKFSESNVNQHYKGEKHKKNVKAYCSVCHTEPQTKTQLWQHLLGAKHKNNLISLGLPVNEVPNSPFDPALPDQFQNKMLVDLCKFCNTSFPNIQAALDHYKSKKHGSKVQKYLKEKTDIGNIKETNDTNKSTGHIDSTNISQQKTGNYFKCFVCKIDFQEESSEKIINHKSTFPHPELAELKSFLVSLGMKEEYFQRHGSCICCNLCNKLVSSRQDFMVHFKSENHKKHFDDWCTAAIRCAEVTSESNTKWFYCRVCSSPLDCTSDAERHYLSKKHQKNNDLYCKVCDIVSPSLEASNMHSNSALHIRKIEERNISNLNGWQPMPLWAVSKEHLIERGVPVGQPTIYTQLAKASAEGPVISSEDKPVVANSEKNDTPTYGEYIQQTNNSSGNSGNVNDDVRFPMWTFSKEIFEKSFPLNIPMNLTNQKTEEKIKTPSVEFHNHSPTRDGTRIEIMNELKKLMQNLYWSNSLPNEVALEFLKNMNKEVEELKKKYVNNSNQGPNLSNKHELNQSGSENGVADTGYKSTENDIPVLNSPTNGENNLSGSSCSANINQDNPNIPPSEPLHSSNGDKYNIGVHREEPNIADESRVDSNLPKEKKYKNKRQSFLKEPENLQAMLQEIIEMKTETDNCIEKDILTEIEKLIEVVNSECIPVHETLKCLQDFNKQIEAEISIENNKNKFVNKPKEAQVKPNKFQYSKDELMSLRTERTFSDLNSRFKKTVTEAKIFRKIKCPMNYELNAVTVGSSNQSEGSF